MLISAAGLSAPGRRWAASVVVFAFGCLVAGLLAWRQDWRNQQHVQSEISLTAERVAVQVVARLKRVELGMLGTRGAALAVGWHELTRQRFLQYSQGRDIAVEFPGVRGLGLIQRVSPDQAPAYTAAAAADGWPGFKITAINPHTDDHFVIRYIEPVARNKEAVGLDIGSEPLRRAAALQSMRTGQATLTGPITLVQATGKPKSGFLILLPVYAGVQQAHDQALGARRVLGWSYAPLVIDEVLGHLDIDLATVHLSISDVDGDKITQFHAPGSADQKLERRFSARVDQSVAGRVWRIGVTPSPDFVKNLNLNAPWFVGAIGMLISLLAAGLLHGRLRMRYQALELGTERDRRAAALQSGRDAILIVDQHGRVTDWNQGAEDLFGYRAQEAIGRTSVDLIVPPEHHAQVTHLQTMGRSGKTMPAYDTVRRHRDGTLIEVSAIAVPTRDPHGAFAGMVITMRDIRPAIKAEREVLANALLEAKVQERTQALSKLQRDLQTVLDAMPSQISYFDRELRNCVANRAYADAFGLKPDAVAGAHALDLMGATLFETKLPRMAAALRGEVQVFEQSESRQHGAEQRHALVHYLPDTVDGQVRGFYTFDHDITELTHSRLKLAAALRESEAFLSTVRTHAIVSVTDHAGRIVEANDNFCAISRFCRDELMGQHHRLINSGAQSAQYWEAMWLSISSGKPWQGEICNRAQDGSLYWLDSMIAPVLGAHGKVDRYVSISFDITERKAFEAKLQRETAKAEAANRAKSEFLANMSHEIRSPLNAVRGLTYLLRQSSLDAEQRLFLDRITLASDALLQTINDVLDISKVEAGALTITRQPFALTKTISDVVAVMGYHGQTKGLPVELHIAADLPRRVVGDGMRLSQVLTNLLSNAIKFTAQGRVAVNASWQPSQMGQGVARLSVVDSGIGIGADALQHVFDPFVQADSTTTRRFGGTGLGLSIVKRMVELMGGRLGVNSTPGAGSEFWIELPYEQAGDDLTPSAREMLLGENALAGKSILVVDDSDINRDVARRILERKGATVVLAEDGSQAIAQLREASPAIDLVLMDVHMPVMDGFEATRYIRTQLHQTRLPILALTAGATVNEREAALASGMNDFVTKPFDPCKLLRTIAHCLGIDNGLVGMTAVAAAADGDTHTEAWPVIDGVDTDDARSRLSHDLRLFKTLLRRLFESFPQLGFGPDLNDKTTRDAAVHMVHKLNGSAGTLGMTRLRQQAAEIESSLRDGQPALAARVAAPLEALNLELARLQRACAPHLDAPASSQAPVPATATATAVEPPAPAQITELLSLMQRKSMRACALFEKLSPGLQARLGDDAWRSLKDNVDNLRFDQALADMQAADPV